MLSSSPSIMDSHLSNSRRRRDYSRPVLRRLSSGFISGNNSSHGSSMCTSNRHTKRSPLIENRETTLPSAISVNSTPEEGLSSSYIMIGQDSLTNSYVTVPTTTTVSRTMRGNLVGTRVLDTTSFDSPLHRPKNAKHLLQLLQYGYDPNRRDSSHDHSAPIHSIVKSLILKDHSNCLETLLIYGKGIDVNARDEHNMTPLHFAAMSGDLRCIKLLLSFGADINAISDFDLTPMNLAIAHYRESAIQLLSLIGGISAAFVMTTKPHPLPPVTHFTGFRLQLSSSDSDREEELERGCDIPMESDRLSDPRLQIETRVQSSYIINEHEAVSLILQQRETNLLHTEEHNIMHSLTYRNHNGSRILCLDGMGPRGLILLEILEQLTYITGQCITDMFDIICGSSIGGLIALGLVYGKKSISELRQFIYQLKDTVYSTSDGLTNEELGVMLNDIIGDQRQVMTDIKEPKIIVYAVNKETSDLKLQAFNNCFNDELSHVPVLTVAQYSILSPTFTHNTTQYVSASLLANNPCDFLLTRLQQYYFSRREQLPVSLVVSVGTGLYTQDNMGTFPRLSLFKIRNKATERRLQNFLVLLRNSLSQSEEVSKNCSFRCKQLGIPYYRFNPELREKVSLFETETRCLLNSVLRTRIELQNVRSRFDELKDYICSLSKAYMASGSGLGGVMYPSDILSPSELVSRPLSSDTTSSGEELQKIHFLRRNRLS